MKLKVQPCSDGIHVYMIGAALFTGTTDTNRCIVDMCNYTGSSTWEFRFVQEHWSIYYYDDITVTDNYVVVVGHKNGSSGHYCSVFTKPGTVATHLIPMIPYIDNYSYSGGTDGIMADPNRPLMIENLSDDHYAIVGYADVSYFGPYDRGTILYIYDAVSNSYVYRCYVPQGFADTADWRLLDFRYNADVKQLYLLQKMSSPISPSIESALCVFDIDNSTWSILGARAFWESGISYNSLDQCANTCMAMAVGENKDMRLWRHDGGGNCVNETQLPDIKLPHREDYLGYYLYRINQDKRPSMVAGSLKEIPWEYICK